MARYASHEELVPSFAAASARPPCFQKATAPCTSGYPCVALAFVRPPPLKLTQIHVVHTVKAEVDRDPHQLLVPRTAPYWLAFACAGGGACTFLCGGLRVREQHVIGWELGGRVRSGVDLSGRP